MKVKSLIKNIEPYLTMVGLLFILSWAGNFSVSHMQNLDESVLVMLTPYGLIRSQFFSEPAWLLPYYHQAIDGFILPDAVIIIVLLWTRFFFFLRKWTL